MILGQNGQTVDPTFPMIIRPEHDADDAVAIRRNQVQVGRLLELTAERIPTLAPLVPDAEPTRRPDLADLVMVLRPGTTDGRSSFMLPRAYCHMSPTWDVSQRSCIRSNTA